MSIGGLLLPVDHIQVRIIGREVVPLWLGEEDHLWVRALMDDFMRLDGRPYHDVISFLQGPHRVHSPAGKRRMVVWTLQRLCARERVPIDCVVLRDALAVEAQRARDAGRFNRSEVIAAGAQRLKLSVAEAEEYLFADLPGERRLCLPKPLPDAHWIAVRTNLALAQGLLRLAAKVTIELYGRARPIIRQVHLRRLLCAIRRVEPDKVRLEISGAFSLFRHTTMYGRALASILPLLTWCEWFSLVAHCVIRSESVSLRLRQGDPIAAGEPPRTYDSRLEERFAREFARANLDWDLVREPEPVETGNALIFPDFAIVHRRNISKRFLLEIVGFWTPEYLQEKFNRLRTMPCTPLVLCVDRELNCSVGELPAHARVVWFRKRIDPNAVIAAIEEAG